jgi:clan AA aspartic protease (TIGR02281 family)
LYLCIRFQKKDWSDNNYKKMKEIPLSRRNNALFLFGKINGSAHFIEFVLDTGCTSTALSKEVADVLFLKGYLKKSDITGYSSSSFGGMCTLRQKDVTIRSISFGKVKVKNIKANIYDRYGGITLLGMAFLDKLKNYSITKDKLIIDDGKPDVVTTGELKTPKRIRKHFTGMLKALGKIREESGVEDFKFDYTKHILQVYAPIQLCYPLLLLEKYDEVIEILEGLQPIIKGNLEDDEKNVYQLGAFVTAYFNFFLAKAYYNVKRYEDALTYFDKAKKFFLSGCSVLSEINDITNKISEKLDEQSKDEPRVFAPAKTTTFEEDVKSYNLQQVDFEDFYYGAGELKTAYVGFDEYDDAYTFCRMNHKRLEVLKKEDGKWKRIGYIPSDNLDGDNLEMEEGYKHYLVESSIDYDLEKLTEQLGDDKDKIEIITKNAEKAKEILEKEFEKKRYGFEVILRKDDLGFDAVIKRGASLSWHGQEYIFAAIDVEEFVTKRLADDVLAGKIIPSAIGQMPEDYTYLSDKTRELLPYGEEDYTANNDPNKNRTLGPFILYDQENCIGYGYRATYDDKIWRWENVTHSNIRGFPEYQDDVTLENDCRICYWQLVVKRDADQNGLILPEAI